MNPVVRAALLLSRMVFILCIPLLVFSLVVAVAFNSLQLYEYGFDKYGVSEDTGLTDDQLTFAAQTLIDYFNSGDEPLEIILEENGDPFSLFTTEESLHMKDVKGLVRLDYGVLAFTGIYVILYSVFHLRRRELRRPFARSVLAGNLLMLAVMLVLGIAALNDFNTLFLNFHFLAFTNDFWSARGYMLKLFPGGFWYDVFIFCAVAMIGITVVAGGAAAGWLYIRGKGLHLQRLLS